MLRLKSSIDFERVRRDGRSHAHPLVVLVALQRQPDVGAPGPDGPPPTRVGFTAGKRVGNAVARNRAKRMLREALRVEAATVAPGWDVVLIARQPLALASLAETRFALSGLLRRARVLADNPPSN